LLEVFAQPTPLVEGAGAVGDRLAVLPVAFHLLWRQVLVTDLTASPLHWQTTVRVADGGVNGERARARAVGGAGRRRPGALRRGGAHGGRAGRDPGAAGRDCREGCRGGVAGVAGCRGLRTGECQTAW